MSKIIIVGLGPGSSRHLTLDAWEILTTSDEIWLRTIHHPVVQALPRTLSLHSFDNTYEKSKSFEDVYVEIASTITRLSQQPGGVVYAVPGHPLVGESTVTKILGLAAEQNIEVRIVDGLSFIEPVLTALSYDPLDGLQVLDALALTAVNYPLINPDFPVLIAQVYSRAVASSLKLVLMNQYPDEHPVMMIEGAGTDRQQVIPMPLYAIDRGECNPLSTLFVTPFDIPSSFEGFQDTVARLRSPEGCPWDREQTHKSLRMNLLEESYEVLDAIDAADPQALLEELGDLLLQVVLHAQIAIEEGEFYMTDVISAIDTKLKRRHPHVWQGLDVDGVGDVVANWEAIKSEERKENGKSEHSLLDSIPRALPALTQAYAYSDRVRRIGFHLEDMTRCPDEVIALMQRLQDSEFHGEYTDYFGNLLFSVVLWAQSLNIDAESALREANLRFANNFRRLESDKDTGKIPDLSDADIMQLWKK
ncbi:MAG: nucleoside triphosphate pyrophosphohydrolase [Anaerolineae bacterium]|nr:nucleoside triphosphate pyrophosphohydrolase [Anaerolineae bacterium]